jgi:hypothetical protein
MTAVRVQVPSVRRATAIEVPNQGRFLAKASQSTCQRRARQAANGKAWDFCKALKNKVLH